MQPVPVPIRISSIPHILLVVILNRLWNMSTITNEYSSFHYLNTKSILQTMHFKILNIVEMFWIIQPIS